jgi:hypothetical protein
LFSPHGDPARNGGLPFGVSWPHLSLPISTQSDELRLTHGTDLLELLTWSQGFPGGLGIAAERIDLESGPAGSNYKPAVTTFGKGDRGTPSAVNSVNRTRTPPRAGVETIPATSSAGPALHFFAAAGDTGVLGLIAVSLSTSPGMRIGNKLVPLTLDPLLVIFLGVPAMLDFVPPTGLRGLRLPLPAAASLRGLPAHCAHLLIDPRSAEPLIAASMPTRFLFP